MDRSIKSVTNGLPYKDYAAGNKIYDTVMQYNDDVKLAIGVVYRMGYHDGKDEQKERNRINAEQRREFYLKKKELEDAELTEEQDSPPEAIIEGSNDNE